MPLCSTRASTSAAFTGRASKGIAGKLRHHAATLISPLQSCFVTKDSHLEPNGEARAREGALLGSKLDRTAPGIVTFGSIRQRALGPTMQSEPRRRTP